MPLAPLPPPIDFLLGHRLRRVAALVRAIKFHRMGAILWSSVALIAAALALVQQRSASLAPYAAPLLLVVFVLATVIAVWCVYRDRSDIATATDYLAARHPELRSALRAAVEQRPTTQGQFHFLQRRVIDDALRHAETRDWLREPRRRARGLLAGHALALIAALGLSAIVIRAHRPAPAGTRATTFLAAGLEITPGDAEFERGSTVVIAARFDAVEVPREAVLVWRATGGATQRAPMDRSLSDPVFAFTITALNADVAYHVEHDRESTRTFALTVFDRPALVRADARLDYPEYTGLADREIVDTRRVSAVTGTQLEYEFIVNKPLARAVLRAADKSEVPLQATADRTRFRLSAVMSKSERFSLHLEDDAGRTNGSPIDIRIEAVENRRPELKLTFPRGDQRVSPLQEMQLQAEARDDFGMSDYGLGLSVGESEPTYLSLAPAHQPPAVQANLDHVLALETYGVKPDQLVTWFAWADDIGPEGKSRRTTSDVFFAEVRRLEEIFREDANGGGNNQAGAGAGGPGEELLETQRQISIATWKLRQQDASAPSLAADAATLRDSQREVQKQLAEVRQRLDDGRARAAADQAGPLMTQAADALDAVAEKKSLDELQKAWAGARGAYEALLRMQPRDSNVSQSRSGGQGGGSRGRDQLNELQFRNEEDRYQTETQAQPPPTPEQRDQLNVLARLRELARRQEDINQRLQELQTALAAAEDEAQREAIRRELKRLEDEQRRMMSEVDEARQRVDRLQPGEQTQQAREQLDRTREDMRRASEQLAQGEVSQALAAGSRARENLQQTSEDLRKEAAGRFGDQMREARRQARELSAAQQEASRQLEDMSRGQQSLDDSAQREQLAQQLQQQAERREGLLDTLRQVTEESDGTEPRLHRQLYDLLRQQGQSGATQELNASAELLRRGFVDPARERQAGVGREIEQLQRAVERAAGSVLGDETNELRFAQRELDELTRELQRDRREGAAGAEEESSGEAPSPTEEPNSGARGEESERLAGTGEPRPGEASGESKGGTGAGNREPGQAGGSAGAPNGGQAGRGSSEEDAEAEAESLAQLARTFGRGAPEGQPSRGPLTGGGFGEWAERLRTVEELMEAPELRQRLAGARFQAEEFRRANQREGKAPQWDLVEIGVVAPLQDARAWLRQELNRREQPDALQPIDRDPVPERYAESVRKYYEALGSGASAEATK